MGPHPAVAAVRSAVRHALQPHPLDRGLLVACSGGGDSTALAAAVAFEAARSGRPAALVTVDHGLQPGSASQARRVAQLGWELGFEPVQVLAVRVGIEGGTEAAARTARYEALEQVRGDALVLLGHTADDQAETVLLGLGRGSGARSLAGMRPERGDYLRPLLALRRVQTVDACLALGLPIFDDPHNVDPRFRRVRVRTEVLPLLEDVLAGGVVEALARTAAQLQNDSDALDVLSARSLVAAVADDGALVLTQLVDQPTAILSRVLKSWAEQQGSAALSSTHVTDLLDLVSGWHGQGPIFLPGNVCVDRVSGRLMLVPRRR